MWFPRGTRIGHTGTLDPMATGVLPIALGEGTKLAPFLLAEDKAYEGELELGVTTTTLDAEGEVTGRSDPNHVTEAALRSALAAWTGDREQVPPMYSALRHGGRRLHELARAGVEVERQPRAIRVDRFELLGFAPPRARFAVDCSKGTYVRCLARDVGEALGCGATLVALRRTRHGAFTLADALALAEVDASTAGLRLVDPVRALAHLPSVTLSPAELVAVRQGRPLPLGTFTDAVESALVRYLTPGGHLAAIAVPKDGFFRTLRVLNYGLTGMGA